jgi:hypothetical protein
LRFCSTYSSTTNLASSGPGGNAYSRCYAAKSLHAVGAFAKSKSCGRKGGGEGGVGSRQKEEEKEGWVPNRGPGWEGVQENVSEVEEAAARVPRVGGTGYGRGSHRRAAGAFYRQSCV